MLTCLSNVCCISCSVCNYVIVDKQQWYKHIHYFFSKFNHNGGGDSENSSVHVSEGGRDSPANQRTSPNNDEWPVPPNEDADGDPMYASVIPKSQRKLEVKSEDGTPMKAVYDFVGEDDDDLSFKEGDIVHIVKQCEDGWAQGIMNGKLGYVPYAYFEDIKK